ncbi:MAG: asparagine synthase (glutamine-hydrolyzing) [Deltaproteobacteria bacterium GWA2_45_12]|nr:MAG: asparagine synthase (glutamine-hydrolyzing) [Deltaproteobacteria bacterium GWA2_45_12]
MCGISGILHKNNKPVSLEILQKMNRTLAHRGPDDEGYFVKGPVGLAQRRLAIIDLSSGGHQPMTSPDGRFTITFNGEIYNFIELKAGLEKKGVLFSTRSDTEVLLQLYIAEGKSCLSKLNGMFAFCIWDERDKKLFAARDRMGKKPFYYWDTPAHFAFASEPKAFRPHPDFANQLDDGALQHYFQYEYVPAPFSIFKGVKKLPQAHFLEWDGHGITIAPYWNIPLGNPVCEDENSIAPKLLDLLDSAVEARLVSDVPLGVFLSGGIDSSAVVGLMARHHPGKDIKTFSIGFEEKSFDETSYARLVAKKFGTDHHEQILTPHKMIEILPNVLSVLDEPFADYSIIPTYLLSAFTRNHVTVALGGDGGDELFAGYPTFFAGHVAQWFWKLPSALQKIIVGAGNALPVSDKDMSFEFKLKQFLYGASFPPVIRNQVWLGAFHQGEQERLFVGAGLPCPGRGNPAPTNPLDLVVETMRHCPSVHPGERMLYFYQKFYLCDDILVKADRASMAHSLEVRAPFLDVNVVEYASRIPYNLKLKGTKTKYILKKALEKILPSEILYRPKKGFGIPISLWLKTELKQEMLRVLDPQKIRKNGLFNPEFITRLVKDHLDGKKNNRKQLFSLLMFQWWRERYLEFSN